MAAAGCHIVNDVSRIGSFAAAALVRLAEVTNRTFVLPVVMFYPTSRCNSRSPWRLSATLHPWISTPRPLGVM